MTQNRVDQSHDDLDQPSFEENLARLEQIVQQLEEGNLGLSQSLEQYELAVQCLKRCYGQLERAEQRVELLSAVDEDGNLVTETFTEEDMSLTDKARARGSRRSRVDGQKNTASPDSGTRTGDMDGSPGLF